jgi:hypothetical protein
MPLAYPTISTSTHNHPAQTLHRSSEVLLPLHLPPLVLLVLLVPVREKQIPPSPPPKAVISPRTARPQRLRF